MNAAAWVMAIGADMIGLALFLALAGLSGVLGKRQRRWWHRHLIDASPRAERRISDAIRQPAPAALPVTIGPWERQEILNYAARFTTRTGDPETVTANAAPLAAWVSEASDGDDISTRVRALRQHAGNIRRYADAPDAPMDDPEAFLAGARKLYDFATAGQVAP